MASKKDEMLSAEAATANPPPPYELSGHEMYDSTDSDSDTDQMKTVPSSGGLTLPGVIPREHEHLLKTYQY